MNPDELIALQNAASVAIAELKSLLSNPDARIRLEAAKLLLERMRDAELLRSQQEMSRLYAERSPQ